MKTLIGQTEIRNGSRKRLFVRLLAVVSALTLSACGDSTSTQANSPSLNTGTATIYTGPAPTSPDIQAFKLEFWDKLSPDNRCGGCHIENGDPPAFVHKGNVNNAYLEAIQVVDSVNFANSLVVTQVRSGHNCWLADNNACGDIIEGYIAAWKGTPTASGRQIILTAPPLKDPGASKNFPATAQDNDPNSFAKTLYPLLTGVANCNQCHAETSATPISPFFASDDVDSAYEAAKAKINLDSPTDSRLVLRLREEFHNCWTNDCLSDAQDVEDQIILMASAITPTQVDPLLITSKALNLDDATIASGGSRYEANTIALWEFKTGSGGTTFDTSGVDPAIDLTFSGTVDWVLGDGIEIINGKAQGSTTSSKKLHDFIKATGEYAVEAWVIPGNVSQEDASIISYSAGGGPRNFTMEQDLYNYTFLNRTEISGSDNGTPALSTANADEDLQASLQHVVMNFDPVNGRQIFVNGVFTDDVEPSAGRSLFDWNPNYAFVLGNEPNSGALWKGKIRLAAIHNRALTQAQITQNFSVGVGKKYFMLFSVADRIGIPDSYILFHVEQFDNFAYLFNEPRFINLDENWVPSAPIIIKGLRIAINGREAVTAQAFANMDENVNSAQYDFTNNGQFLSDRGTIIPLEKGPQSDEFFLTFEQIGSSTNPFTEADPTAPGIPADAAAVSDIGLRTFEEINATMSAVTGVPTTETTVNATYDTYRQQLPVVENISTYLASHQMAIAQLAMSYCNVLVNTDPGYFSGFTFSTASTAFDSPAKKAAVIDPLLTAIMNVDTNDATNNLQTQPNETVIRNMLGSTATQDLDAALTGDAYESLITNMTQCAIGGSPTCDSTTRTEEIVKATCAATLGSAAMLIQ